jgi:hypothetical protein
LTTHLLQDVFIVDNGEAGVWVWVGKGASKQERRGSMKNAEVSAVWLQISFAFIFVGYSFSVSRTDGQGWNPEIAPTNYYC